MEQLLKLIETNPTLTPKQLAVMLGREEARVKEMIDDCTAKGIIKGYHATINWEKVENAQVTALIALKVTPKPESGFEEIAARIAEYPEVKSVYLMAGAYDLALFVQDESMQAVSSFVSRKLSALDGILSTATYFVLKSYKENGVVFEKDKKKKDKRSLIL